MIGLVSCGAQKLEDAAPARSLYTSPLFRLSLQYAEERCETTYVLSAAHGLVDLDRVLKPYDRRLGGKKERAIWARRVAGELVERHGRDVDYLILAGVDYAGPLSTALCTIDGHRRGDDGGFRWHGVDPSRILQPLARKSIGPRLQWLSASVRRAA